MGCYWGNIFAGALAYADDLTLLAPSTSALRKLLAICEKSGSVLRLTFNPDKTQCIRFSRERDKEDMELHFGFVASISAVLSMLTILDISYHMIFRMIWIFRGASVISLGGLMVYCHILVFVLQKF